MDPTPLATAAEGSLGAAVTRTRRLLSAPGAVPLLLTALCAAVAFAQRPGRAYNDSRIELSVDPVRFLSDVTHVWSSSGDLGHVQGGLFAGYLVPMAPWYASAHELGLGTWVAQRLWFALLLTLAAWGAVRLMDALFGRRGVGHATAGALYALSPYVVVSFAVRGTIPLQSYAALPWLLLAVHHGLRHSRNWVWPGAGALAVALAGGAINSAYIVWIVAAAVALALYEVGVLGIARRALWSFGWRTLALTALLSAWWVVPLALQGSTAPDYQQFTEQQGTIWATTSLSESLRLLGFWDMYLGAGFGQRAPQLGIGADYLFDPLVIIATFALPLLAVGGLLLKRRWRYGPFFGLLAVGSLLVMSAGFPPGAPLRRGLTYATAHIQLLELLRTTYKAAPLTSLSFACLGGAAVAALAGRTRGATARRLALAGVVAAALALACLPLVEGRAIDATVAYGHVPSYWKEGVAHATHLAGPSRRVLVEPGHVLAYYRWGSTSYSVAPPLSEHPVSVRELTRYADARSSELFDATDRLIQQERLVPGQLPVLLKALGVGAVLVPTDSNVQQSGSLPPAAVPDALEAQRGFGQPDTAFGRLHRFPPLAGRAGSSRTLPDLRSYPVRGSRNGLVRLQPAAAGAVLDGDAQGVVELAAHDHLGFSGPVLYAGDVATKQLRGLVRGGAELVFTDSGRRQVVSASRLRNDLGPTLGRSDPISSDSPTYRLFPQTDGHRTVASYTGLSYLRAPEQPAAAKFPEHRPYAALDGRLDTSWIPTGVQRYLELALAQPRRIDAIRVRAHNDSESSTSVLGVSVDGGSEHRVSVGRAWKRIPIGRTMGVLRIRVVDARDRRGQNQGGGIDELRIPGVRVEERLELPADLARAAGGLDLSHAPLTILLQRTTADFPYRAGNDVGAASRLSAIDMVDAEAGIEREVTLPEARTFATTGWASASPTAPDDAIDDLTGIPGSWRLTSSGRFEGVAGRRASAAFDRDPRTAWIGPDLAATPPWLALRAPRPFELRGLTLGQGGPDYHPIKRVTVRGDRGQIESAGVGAGGRVRLGRPMRTRTLRLELATRRVGRLPAVALRDVAIPGLRTPAPRRSGRFSSRCGELLVSSGGRTATALVSGSVRGLDAGRPLRVRGCGSAARLPLRAGRSGLSAPPGTVFRPDHLMLRAGAPRPLPRPPSSGVVIDPGHGTNGAREGVRLQVRSPSWLVLGESYSRGWRAWCTGPGPGERGLGASTPVDGFANGWLVPPGCRKARFAFQPQRAAVAGYVISALTAALLALAGLAALVRRRRRRGAAAGGAGSAAPVVDPSVPDPLVRLSWRPALGWGAAVAAAGAFLFALRAGVLLGPMAVALLLVGVNARRLLVAAAAGLAVLPVIYIAFPPRDQGGYNFDYAVQLMGAHWVAVGIVCCIGAGCGLAAVRLARS